jgi:hypothetical protein
LFLFSASTAGAQIMVNNVDVNTVPAVKYIEVTCQMTAAKGKNACAVFVDYGQKWNAIIESRMGEPGKAPLEFDGYMAVLNLFYKNGWELVPIQMYAPTGPTKIFLFQKKV